MVEQTDQMHSLATNASAEIAAAPRRDAAGSQRRFHDLDSLRAAMMLQVLVFHVAWFFLPGYFFNARSDVQGNAGYYYFFSWVHEFRMQTFFMIAGFFAALLIRKRGHWDFLRNRLLRIAVPFLLSMLILFPLLEWQMLRGGLASGRIQSNLPLGKLFVEQMAGLDWVAVWPYHFWFLNTLMVVYAVSLGLTVLFHFLLDRQGTLRFRIKEAINRLVASQAAPFILAIPVAVLMSVDLMWFGINEGTLLSPNWNGVFAYWTFFAIGWCLYASPNIIDSMQKRWPAYLVIGSVIAFGLTGYFQQLWYSGRANPFYPALMCGEVDYPQLRTQLLLGAEANDRLDSLANIELAEAGESQKYSTLSVIWNLLSSEYQEFVLANKSATAEQEFGLCSELTMKVTLNPEFQHLMLEETSNTAVVSRFNPIENRQTLETIMQGALVSRWETPAWIRVSYFYAYALASWLLTFAMLGLFRKYFARPNPTIRYLADSSYWLYLAHIPVQFELAIHLAGWQANSLLKFVIYNVLTFAILLPSYHYLVRPTWLGWLLNGRAYPLKNQGREERLVNTPRVA